MYGVALYSVWHFALCGLIQEVAPQIQEVAPTTCVVWHFAPCGTLLCSVWYFALCGEWILEVAPTDSRDGPPPCVWCGILLRVALSSIQDPPNASMIVGYILVIPTPGMLCQTPV